MTSPVAAERKRNARQKGEKDHASFGVLIVQSIACVALVLFIWLFSSFGGVAVKQLRGLIGEQLADNSLATAVSIWFDDRFVVEEEETGATENNQSEDNKSSEKTDATFVASVNSYVPPENAVVIDVPAVLPIEQSKGEITSTFGNRDNPTASGSEFHKGLDIAAEKGTHIAAMMFGVVTDAGNDKWLGNYVVLAHGDMEVTYAHCSQVIAEIGSVVKAGETVAKVGSTGNSTGNHLHIEVRKNGVLCDPATIVSVAAYD